MPSTSLHLSPRTLVVASHLTVIPGHRRFVGVLAVALSVLTAVPAASEQPELPKLVPAPDAAAAFCYSSPLTCRDAGVDLAVLEELLLLHATDLSLRLRVFVAPVGSESMIWLNGPYIEPPSAFCSLTRRKETSRIAPRIKMMFPRWSRFPGMPSPSTVHDYEVPNLQPHLTEFGDTTSVPAVTEVAFDD